MGNVVLVTGGAGYIGSQTCKVLAGAGYLPVSLDSMVSGHRWAVRWGDLVQGDILDAGTLDEVFSRYRPLAVVHFAAFAYIGESVADPGKYYRNNVAGTLSVLEAMLRHGCRRMVFSSSCATYGEPREIPIPESHGQRPVNPYGWTKLMIERMLKDFDLAHGVRHVSLRYFNAAGADPDGELGEDHDPETHLIPLAIFSALGLRGPLPIFGTDYATPDGTPVRDYIHVADLARAHVAAMGFLLDGDRSECFNLGTGTGHSVAQVVEAVERVGGIPVPRREASRRTGDPPALVALADKAGRVLGWRPEIPGLEDIVQTAWDWHAKHHAGR